MEDKPRKGELKPFVYRMREGERLWVVFFRDEIKYKSSSRELAIYYAETLSGIWNV